jgi:MFS family permease
MFLDNSKANKQQFVIVLSAIVLTHAASFMAFRFIPLRVSSLFDSETTSKIISFSLVSSLIFIFIGGWLSQVAGRPQAILIAISIKTIGCALIVFSPTVQIMSIVYTLSASADSILLVSFWVFLVEKSTVAQRGMFFGLFFGLSGFLGKRGEAFALGLINSFEDEVSRIFALVMFCVTIGVLLISLYWRRINQDPFEQRVETSEYAVQEDHPAIAIKRNSYIPLLIISSVIGFAFLLGTSSTDFLAISDVFGMASDQRFSLIYAEFAFDRTMITLLVMILSGWLSDRYGERPIVAGSITLTFLGILSSLLFKDFHSVMAQFLVVGLASTIFSPAFNSFLSKTLPEKDRAKTYGLFAGISSILSLMLFPVKNMFVRSFQAAFPFMLVILLLVFLLVWWKMKPPTPTEPSAH